MQTLKKPLIFLFGLFAFVLLFWTGLNNVALAAIPRTDDIQGPIVGEQVVPGSSPAVRDLPVSLNEARVNSQINPRHNPLLFEPDQGKRGTWDRINVPLDSLIQTSRDNMGRTPGLDLSFDGTGNPTACGGCSPPDTNGDVGPNHYIQMVNATKVAIYSKSGTLISGPFNLGTLWTSGACTANAGDPIVLYDSLADRWLLSQFASPSYMCVAISQTSDPTGTYYTYMFNVGEFPDYFKFGVWPDGYYMSANETSYTAYAFERTNMLAGTAATFQKFTGGTNLYLPSDVDGSTAPPAGAPNYFYTFKDAAFHSLSSDRLEIRAFDVDWVTPANSTFSLVSSLDVTPFTYTVCGFFNLGCVQQLGTTQRIDTVSEWPMFRFPYRNFGTHQSLVGTFTVGGGTGEAGAAIRWFELRNTGAGWTLFQEGTFDPGDGHDRFMASIAMDGEGNIALGYSVSSSTMNPAIRYATRLASDPLGTMQAEAVLINGSGSQTGSNRWGDYSGMAVDPVNDCSFWYTNEYYPANASSTWNTRVGVFRISGCSDPDFTLEATPTSQAICTPNDAVFTVDIGSIKGYSDPVTLSTSGNPAGTTVGFNTNPVNPPGTSDMTIGNTQVAAAGSYSIDVQGIAPTSTHTTTVTLDIYTGVPGPPILVDPANGVPGVDRSPTLEWTAVANAQNYDLEVATDPEFTNVVYSAAGVAGTSHTLTTVLDPLTAYFWRVRANNSVCGNGIFSADFSFTTEDVSLILLVDDDDNNPNVQTIYTEALDSLGMSYDIWDTENSDNEPIASYLTAYQAVIWFTGGEYGGFAGPGSTGETALETWLDNNNGCLFLSSQDYFYDRGLTPFMSNYLGAASISNDNGDYSAVAGQGSVFGGLGPYNLAYAFTDYSDIITPTLSAELALLGNNSNGAAVNQDSGTYQTTFWVFPWEAIDTTAGREATLQAFLVDTCGITPPKIDTGGNFEVVTVPDEVVTETLTISNTGATSLNWMIGEEVKPSLVGEVDVDRAGSAAACSTLTDIPWVSASPASGTTTGGGSSDVSVVFDSANLGGGVYTGTLCLSSNDPVTPLVAIPLTLTVDDKAELSISKTAPGNVTVGDIFVYEIEVTNAGLATAFSTTINDTLPPEVTFVSATAGCSNTVGVVTCNLGDLGSGVTATVDIVVQAVATGLLTNTAEVSSLSPDPNTSNNSDSASTNVAPRMIYLPLINH